VASPGRGAAHTGSHICDSSLKTDVKRVPYQSRIEASDWYWFHLPTTAGAHAGWFIRSRSPSSSLLDGFRNRRSAIKFELHHLESRSVPSTSEPVFGRSNSSYDQSFGKATRRRANWQLNSDCPNSRKRQKARWISYGLRLRIYFCRALTVSAGEATMVLRRLALDPTVRIAVAVIATAPTLPIAQLGRVVTPVRKVTIPGVPFADGAHLASGALPRIRRLRVARRKAISCPAPGPRATRRSEPAPSGQPKWRCPQVRRVRRV
jgi:hypothetical protein